MTNAVYYVAGIIQSPIIRIQLNDCQTERAGLLRLFRVPFSSKLPQIRFIKAMSINAANKPIGIAGRFQVYRRSPGLYESPDGY